MSAKPIEIAFYAHGATIPEVRSVDNELEVLQGLVAGYLETVRLPDGLLVVCNEEGNLHRLPVSFAVAAPAHGWLGIAGEFFVCRVAGSEFASIRPASDLPKLLGFIRPV